MELATLDGARRRERRATTTLPERLRSALTARGWVRRPEPRVALRTTGPAGTSALGAGDRAVAARVRRLRGGGRARDASRTYGATLTLGERPDWFPRAASPEWQRALHALDELVAIARRRCDVDRAGRAPPLVRARDVARARLGAPRAGRPCDRVERARARAPACGTCCSAGGLRARAPEGRGGAARSARARCWEQAEALAAAICRRIRTTPGSSPRRTRSSSPAASSTAWRRAAGPSSGRRRSWAQLREQVREDGGHESRSPVWQSLRARRVSRHARRAPRRQRRRADVGPEAREGHGRLPRAADASRRHADGVRDEHRRRRLAGGGAARDGGDRAPRAGLRGGARAARRVAAPRDRRGRAGGRTPASATSSPVPQARALRRTGFFVLAGDPGDAMIVDGAVRPCTDGVAAFGSSSPSAGCRSSSDRRSRPSGRARSPSTRARRARGTCSSPRRPHRRRAPTAEIRYTVRDGVQYFSGEVAGLRGPGSAR